MMYMTNEQPPPLPDGIVPPPTAPIDIPAPPTGDGQGAEDDTSPSAESAQPEQRERPPVLPKRQENEIRSIGELLIEESIMSHDQLVASAGEKPKARDAKKKELRAQNRANHVIQSIQWLRTDNRNFMTSDSPKGFSFEGTALPIVIDGKEMKIQYVAKFDGDNVHCFTENTTPIALTRLQLERALIINEREALQDNASPVARDGLAAYIDALDADAHGTAYRLPDNASKIIESAAPTTGMVLSESMRSAVDTHHDTGKISDAEQERMHKLLDGTLIADPEIVAHLLYRLGDNSTKVSELTDLQKKITDEIAKLQELPRSQPMEIRIAELTGKLSEVERDLTIYEAYPSTEEAVKELVFKLYNGKLPIANPERLDTAIRDGDIDAFFDELIDEGSLSEDEINKFKKLKDAAKILGIGSMIILVLMLMQSGTGGGR